MCRESKVCRQIFLGVLPNLKMPKKVCKNSYIFSILVYFLHLGVPSNLFSKLVCHKLKKVENRCLHSSQREKKISVSKVSFPRLQNCSTPMTMKSDRKKELDLLGTRFLSNFRDSSTDIFALLVCLGPLSVVKMNIY